MNDSSSPPEPRSPADPRAPDTTPSPAPRGTPRVTHGTIRVGRVVLAVAAVLAAGAIALTCMATGPGRARPEVTNERGADAASLEAELRTDVETLALTIGERHVGRPASLAAAERHVLDEFRRAGLTPTTETYVVEGVTCANVIAEVPGTDPRAALVVVGAHYDSATGSPGANDDATGVAATLALARRFARGRANGIEHARTIRFVAFVNEEPPWFETPLMGSRVHVARARVRGDDVHAMLALETLGCFRDEDDSQRFPSPVMAAAYPSRGDFVAFVSDLGSRALTHAIVEDFRAVATVPSEVATFPEAVPGIGWSDHRSFWLAGWKAVMVTDTAVYRDEHYHRATDLPRHVDFARLARVVQGLEHVVTRLASTGDAR